MEAAWPEMAYGESGDPAPSLIPHQVTAPSDEFHPDCVVGIFFFGI
jgi:hypothetical protein